MLAELKAIFDIIIVIGFRNLSNIKLYQKKWETFSIIFAHDEESFSFGKCWIDMKQVEKIAFSDEICFKSRFIV